MRNRKSTIILLVSFFIGLSVLLYPTVSSFWNAKTQSQAVVNYEAMLARIEAEDFDKYFDEAAAYNAQLTQVPSPLLNYDAIPDYWEILDVSGTGMLGYLTIPKLGQEFAVYHGTGADVLSFAVGHLQGSSHQLRVGCGGPSYHPSPEKPGLGCASSIKRLTCFHLLILFLRSF